MAVVGGVASIAGGLVGSSSAKKAARAAAREKARLQKKLNNLEENRQDVINPYEDVKSLSSMISNPFANLSVATKAAEMKIEEADISLANTLDAVRATGGAGSATALANAALRSKKDVAASVEQQEKANEDKRRLENNKCKELKWLKSSVFNQLKLLESNLYLELLKVESKELLIGLTEK